MEATMFEQVFKNIDDILWKEAGCSTELDYTEQTSWLLFLKYLDDLEQEPAENCRESLITKYPDEELQAFLDFVLQQYVSDGVMVLDQEKLPKLLQLKYQSTTDGSRKLSGTAFIRDTFMGFQKSLYVDYKNHSISKGIRFFPRVTRFNNL